jgi:hypothetical protein
VLGKGKPRVYKAATRSSQLFHVTWRFRAPRWRLLCHFRFILVLLTDRPVQNRHLLVTGHCYLVGIRRYSKHVSHYLKEHVYWFPVCLTLWTDTFIHIIKNSRSVPRREQSPCRTERPAVRFYLEKSPLFVWIYRILKYAVWVGQIESWYPHPLVVRVATYNDRLTQLFTKHKYIWLWLQCFDPLLGHHQAYKIT